MNKKKVTSTDVAKKAGVSQTTVSMILNKKYNVSFSKETIHKVEEAAQLLGYEKSTKKPACKCRMKDTLFVISPSVNSPYYQLLMDGIHREATRRHFQVFVCQTERNLRNEERLLYKLSRLSPSGIIYTCVPGFPDLVNEMASSIPMVFIGKKIINY